MLDGLNDKFIITVEDNALIGGFGSLINGYFADKNSGKIIKNFAYSDKFIPQGGVSELMEDLGFSADALADYIIENEN